MEKHRESVGDEIIMFHMNKVWTRIFEQVPYRSRDQVSDKVVLVVGQGQNQIINRTHDQILEGPIREEA